MQINRFTLHCIVWLVGVFSFGIPDRLGGADLSGSQDRREAMRVLFIGNSLTFANDLPAIVEALAGASRQKPLHYKSVAFPDYSLEDHWAQGDARKAISNETWDVVVLQQGPSALPESRQLLLKYTRLFDGEIRASGARPALYMVWPSEARFKDFDRVVESYRLAADEVNGLLFPVGQAWREAWKMNSTIQLYSGDRFHPSIAGSYLAALVIYEKLYERSPSGLPGSLKLRSKVLERMDLGKEEASVLQAAARESNKRFR
jgi:hypothetical protein